MTEQEIVTKVSIDEVEISKPSVETVNVEEVASQIAEITSRKESTVAMYDALILENTTNKDKVIEECDAQIAELQVKLDKASVVWVTPDGVEGEYVEPVVETPVVEETPTEPTTEVQYDPIDWSIIG